MGGSPINVQNGIYAGNSTHIANRKYFDPTQQIWPCSILVYTGILWRGANINNLVQKGSPHTKFSAANW